MFGAHVGSLNPTNDTQHTHNQTVKLQQSRALVCACTPSERRRHRRRSTRVCRCRCVPDHSQKACPPPSNLARVRVAFAMVSLHARTHARTGARLRRRSWRALGTARHERINVMHLVRRRRASALRVKCVSDACVCAILQQFNALDIQYYDAGY